MQVHAEHSLSPGDLKEFNAPFIQCGAGWKNLYEPVIEECRKLGIHVDAVKRLHGGLRFQIGPTYTLNGASIYRYIDDAERVSYNVCEICGEEGSLRSKDGFLQTLCHSHAIELKFDACPKSKSEESS